MIWSLPKLFTNSESKRGTTLVIAVLLTFLFVSITNAITTFVFRELQLTGGGAQSLRAFYAADTALECALDADLNDNLFFQNSVTSSNFTMSDCGSDPVDFSYYPGSNSNCVTGSAWCYVGSVNFVYNSTLYQATVRYTYLDTDEVVLSARGTYGTSGPRSVERGLEYRYPFSS